MQSLIALIVQLTGKAWVVIIVTALGGGAATVFYFSSSKAGSNPTPGNPPAVVPVAHADHPVGTLGPEHCTAPMPVVPEANAGLVLMPVVAAMLLVSSRRLCDARRTLVADGQDIKGTS